MRGWHPPTTRPSDSHTIRVVHRLLCKTSRHTGRVRTSRARADATKNPASFETGQFIQACSELVAVAISMTPVATAVGISRGCTNDRSANTERNPTAIVPIATAAMMTVTATIISAVSVMPAAVSVTRTCIGRRGDHCEWQSGCQRGSNTDIFPHCVPPTWRDAPASS